MIRILVLLSFVIRVFSDTQLIYDNTTCACRDRSKMNFAFLTHHDATTDQWSSVRNGAYQAARDLHVNLQWIEQSPENLNTYMMNIPLTTYDGFIITPVSEIYPGVRRVTNFSTVRDTLSYSISVLDGLSIFNSLGVDLHIGIDPQVLSQQTTDKIISFSTMRTALFLGDDSDSDFQNKVRGFNVSTAARNISVSIEILQSVSLSKLTTILSTIDMVIVGSSPCLNIIIQAKQSLPKRFLPIGILDFDQNIGSAIQSGVITIAADSQPYYSGYMSVLLQVLYATTHSTVTPSNSIFYSGPSFVTSGNVKSRLCQLRGVYYCDDSRSLPTNFPSDCSCISRGGRIVGASIGGPGNAFWGMYQEASQMAVIDSPIEYSYRVPQIYNDVAETINILNRAIAEDPRGILCSLTSDSFAPILAQASRENIPVIAMNSGALTYTTFGALMYIGQMDGPAAYTAALEWLALTTPFVTPTRNIFMIVNHNTGAISIATRSQYIKMAITNYATTYSINITYFEVVVDPNNIQSGVDALTNALTPRVSQVPGICSLGTTSHSVMSQVLTNLIRAGSMTLIPNFAFDATTATIQRLTTRELSFTVDQQPFVQAWLSPLIMAQYSLTGYITPASTLWTGPRILKSGANVPWKNCEAIGFELCPFPATKAQPGEIMINQPQYGLGTTSVVPSAIGIYVLVDAIEQGLTRGGSIRWVFYVLGGIGFGTALWSSSTIILTTFSLYLDNAEYTTIVYDSHIIMPMLLWFIVGGIIFAATLAELFKYTKNNIVVKNAVVATSTLVENTHIVYIVNSLILVLTLSLGIWILHGGMLCPATTSLYLISTILISIISIGIFWCASVVFAQFFQTRFMVVTILILMLSIIFVESIFVTGIKFTYQAVVRTTNNYIWSSNTLFIVSLCIGFFPIILGVVLWITNLQLSKNDFIRIVHKMQDRIRKISANNTLYRGRNRLLLETVRVINLLRPRNTADEKKDRDCLCKYPFFEVLRDSEPLDMKERGNHKEGSVITTPILLGSSNGYDSSVVSKVNRGITQIAGEHSGTHANRLISPKSASTSSSSSSSQPAVVSPTMTAVRAGSVHSINHNSHAFRLGDIMSNPITIELLKDCMIKQNSVENLFFYLDAQVYRHLKNDVQRRALGTYIMSNYITDNALHQINISSHYRDKVIKSQSNGFTESLFHEVEHEVLGLISSQFMTPLRETYGDLCQNVLNRYGRCPVTLQDWLTLPTWIESAEESTFEEDTESLTIGVNNSVTIKNADIAKENKYDAKN